MIKPLTGMKVAVLAANGFNEQHFIAMQKNLLDQGAVLRIISTNQGLVNGWDGVGWGHNFAVDAPLNTALGVDYDALIIVGGERSLDKLKLTAHTRRFIGSFMASEKAVIVMEDALGLMIHTEQLNGRTVAGHDSMRSDCEGSNATWMEGMFHQDGAMLTGSYDDSNKDSYFDMMNDMLVHNVEFDQAA